MVEQHLRAALVRVDVGNRTLATASPGESMAGVPANLRMHFRIGSVATPYLIDPRYQLHRIRGGCRSMTRFLSGSPICPTPIA